MIDIKLIRENIDKVKENIKKKFQDEKIALVDEVYDLDKRAREVQVKVDTLKADKNKLSGEIGKLMKDGKKDEVEKIKNTIAESAKEISGFSNLTCAISFKLYGILLNFFIFFIKLISSICFTEAFIVLFKFAVSQFTILLISFLVIINGILAGIEYFISSIHCK